MRLSFTIGLKYTFSRKKNSQKNQLVSFLSGVSICGLMLGVGLLLAVLSVMNGFDRELREKILGLVPQAVITHADGIEDWPSVVKQLEEQPGVIAGAPYNELYGLIARGKEAFPAVVFGVDVEREPKVSLVADYIPQDILALLATTESALVLGADLAGKLGVAAGDKVMLVVPGKDSATQAASTGYFEVLSTIETQTELDSNFALTSLAATQSFLPYGDRVSGVRLKLDNIFNAPMVVYSSVNALGAGYSGNNWTNTHGNLHHAIKMSKNLVGLLMSLIVAIAAFNVIATLILVVVDKQGDIAILRTLGLTTRQVMAVFVVQGCLIGLIGTLAGVVLGGFLSLVVEELVRAIEWVFQIQFLKSDVYPLTYLPSEILFSDVWRVSITALALCFLATLYPAWRAGRVQPAQALRYE